MNDRRLVFRLLMCTAFLGACKKAEVTTYRVPKETVAQATPAAAAPTPTSATPAPTPGGSGGGTMASTPVATASGAGLTWSAPAHWTSKPASAMRKATYVIKAEGGTGESELSITAFPGDVGGELANLNRWREQVQLPPISQGAFESAVQRLERNGLKIVVADIAGSGANAKRTLGAMVPHAGSTWFFKLGPAPDALVAREKAAFLAFLDTIKPAAR